MNKPRGFAALPVCEAAGGRETVPSSFLGLRVLVDPTIPPNTVEFRNDAGELVGRITGIADPGHPTPEFEAAVRRAIEDDK